MKIQREKAEGILSRHVCYLWWALVPLVAAYFATGLSAWAMSGTTQVAWPGQAVKAQADWPPGVVDLVNHPLRTDGWNPWFSEWPNDINHYLYKVENMPQMNELVKKLADIKAPVVQLRLNPEKEPRGLGFTTQLKKGNGCALTFSLGNQGRIDDWYKRLLEEKPGVKKFGVHRYREVPKALPPTITLYAGHEAVDLKALRVPKNVTVSADISEAARKEKAEDPVLRAIDEFVASSKIPVP